LPSDRPDHRRPRLSGLRLPRIAPHTGLRPGTGHRRMHGDPGRLGPTRPRMQLIAPCPEETKPALVLELEALGARRIAPAYRAVAFEAAEPLFYEVHLKLRTASRILRVIKE